MNIIQKILNTYSKGQKYDALSKKYNEEVLAHDKTEQTLNKERVQFTEAITSLENELVLVYDDLEVATKEASKLKELLASDELDINSLKNWYEGRRSSSRWLYDGKRLGKVDVKLYLRPSDNKPFVALAKELITKYKLSNDMKEEDVILAIYKYWNLRSSWKYRLDKDGKYNSTDYWDDPTEALAERLNDCETKAHCMYNTIKQVFLLLGMSDSFWRLTFVASTLVGYTGHGFLTWLHTDGEYYVIESTYDSVNSLQKTWLYTPMRFNNLYGTPWGFATDEKSWLGSNSALLKFKPE